MNATRGSIRGFLRRLVLVALAAVLIGGCVSGPDPARIGSDGAAYLRRAADNIEQASADLDRAAEHWRRALTLSADAWPELQAELQSLDSAAERRRRDDALLRRVAGQLRSIADGSPVPPEAWFVDVAGLFRDVAARVRRAAHDVAPRLESIRTAEEGGAVRDRAAPATGASAVDELVEAADAMKDAAARYGTAADEIDRAAAEGTGAQAAPHRYPLRPETAPSASSLPPPRRERASTEHAAARQAQASLLARAAEHFNQAAADADRAAVYLDRAAGTMLAINGVKPAHVQGFSELELSLRYVAHVLREGTDTLRRARLPLSREQSRNMPDAVRKMRSAWSFVRGLDRVRELLTDLRTEGQELPAADAAALADAVEDIESALDSVESMLAHTAAAATELERLAEAPP